MSPALPTSQQLRPPFPWLRLPWIQTVSPQLPMSVMEASGVRAREGCVWSPCLGRRKGAHLKIERWAEHQSWMGRCSMDRFNNQPNDGVGEGHWRRDTYGRNAWRKTFTHRSRQQNERRKKKNREGNGASDFDGCCRIGGDNNQPKVDRIVEVYLGETACRAMTMGEDAVESFWPSDFGAKII